MGMSILINYVPMYFQASRGWSSGTSGLYLLALVVPDPISVLASGAAASWTGHYIPFIAGAAAMLSLGAGLLSTLNLNTDLGHILGYEIITGIGFGLAVNLPLTAVRNSVTQEDIPVGNAMFVFAQGFGIVLAPSCGQAVFLTTLLNKLRGEGLSGTDIDRIVALGAANVDANHLGPSMVPFIQGAYNDSARSAMYLSVASAGLACISSFFMEWKRIKPKTREQQKLAEIT